jgi:hypothetical protein
LVLLALVPGLSRSWLEEWLAAEKVADGRNPIGVCTENLIRVGGVMESPKLAE